jgi:hypothetical protein
MTCPRPQQWHLLTCELLDASEAQALQTHAADCAACRAALTAARRDHAALLRGFELFDHTDSRARAALVAALPRHLPPPARSTPAWLRRPGALLRTPRVRWAAVALLPAACVAAALLLVLSAMPRVALAQAIDRVRQAGTLVCRITTTVVTTPHVPSEAATTHTSTSTLRMFHDGDVRAWLYEEDRADGTTARTLFRPEGVYLSAGDQRFVARAAEPPAHGEGTLGPAEWVERLLRVTADPDRRLGTASVAGRPAVGFQVAGWKLGYGAPPDAAAAAPDGVVSMRIWVDVDTHLPVRIETEQTGRTPGHTLHITSRWEDLRWDVPLDAADFAEPSVTPGTPTVDLPTITETAAIDALRAWLDAGERARATFAVFEERARAAGELFPPQLEAVRTMAALDAGYPTQLDLGWLMSSYMVRAQFAQPPDEMQMPSGESAGRATAQIIPLAAFYQKLATDGRRPEYFGPQVTPGDASAVLLRWMTPDGRTRAIHGDLSVATLPDGQ